MVIANVIAVSIAAGIKRGETELGHDSKIESAKVENTYQTQHLKLNT